MYIIAVATGTGRKYMKLANFTLDRGRYFNEEEIRSTRRVAVLGATVVKNLFGNINPIPPWIYEPTIEKLVERVKKLLKNPKKLQELSNEQLKWYEDHKKYIKDLILK